MKDFTREELLFLAGACRVLGWASRVWDRGDSVDGGRLQDDVSEATQGMAPADIDQIGERLTKLAEAGRR